MQWLKRFIGKNVVESGSAMDRAVHGVELVSRSSARRVFSELAGVELCAERGFAPRKDGTLVRRISADVVQLADVTCLKGSQFQFAWGVSLSFVPHSWKRKPSWHRTEASARLDLFQFADDHFSASSPCPFYIDGLHGEEVFREDAVRVWNLCRSTMTAWLDRITNLDEVAREAERQMQNPGPGERHHWPSPSLVQAFLWAHRGEAERAADAWTQLVADDGGGFLQPHEGLRAALAAVSKQAPSAS